jgi:hypothetical protein
MAHRNALTAVSPFASLTVALNVGVAQPERSSATNFVPMTRRRPHFNPNQKHDESQPRYGMPPNTAVLA